MSLYRTGETDDALVVRAHLRLGRDASASAAGNPVRIVGDELVLEVPGSAPSGTVPPGTVVDLYMEL